MCSAPGLSPSNQTEKGVLNYITKRRRNGLNLGDQSYHVREEIGSCVTKAVATLALGSQSRLRGLQGCGPRGSPGVKARRSPGVTSHTPGSVRKCEGVNPHTPKATPTWEMESRWTPGGLSKLQRAIAGVKPQCLVAFFISLESSRSVNV